MGAPIISGYSHEIFCQCRLRQVLMVWHGDDGVGSWKLLYC